MPETVLQRSNSRSSFSSAGSSNGSTDAIIPGLQNLERFGDTSHDMLEEKETLQSTLFGVIFTLKSGTSFESRQASLLKIALEFLQMLNIILSPHFGWTIDHKLWFFKILALLSNWTPMLIEKGYSFYLIIFYTLAAAMALCVLTCLYIAWSWRKEKFVFMWPVRLLQWFLFFVTTALSIITLEIIVVVADCNFFAVKKTSRMELRAFPDISCRDMPQAAHCVVAVFSFLVMFNLQAAMTASEFCTDPLSRRLMATPHPYIEFRMLIIKTSMVLISYLLSDRLPVQAIILSLAQLYITWSFVRWAPHLVEWVNHLRAGLCGASMWASVMLIILVFHPERHLFNVRKRLTIMAALGLAPSGALVYMISFLRVNLYRQYALSRLKKVPPNKRPWEYFKFSNPYEAEIAARCARKWDDNGVLDPKRVAMAETVLKTGVALFPNNMFIGLCWGNFQIEVQGNYQTGHSQIQAVKKMKTTLIEKYAVFVREQEHRMKAQSQGSTEVVDLVSYVEFQRNYRMLIRCHKMALAQMKTFWRKLLHHKVKAHSLAKALSRVNDAKERAVRAYRLVLERYPKSSRLIRSYGRFLEDVLHNSSMAKRLYKEADRMTEQSQDPVGNGDGGMGDSVAGMLSQVDENSNAMVVINASGIIQMTNKTLLRMFGYKRSELDGKNVSLLMPQPYSQRHTQYIRNYITTGKATVLDRVNEMVVQHKERYVFPVKNLITKVSGAGSDTIFMGILKTIEEDPECVRVWLLPVGTILCVQQRFIAWFGKTPNEVVGRPFATLVSNQPAVAEMLDLACSMEADSLRSGALHVAGMMMMHKYGEPINVNLQVKLGGTESQRILVITIQRMEAAPSAVITVDSKGQIIYSNSAVSELLGYSNQKLAKMDLSMLMSSPFSHMHKMWMKDMTAKIPSYSCRAGRTVLALHEDGNQIPVKLDIVCRKEHMEQLYVVTLHKSTLEKGFEERRASFIVDMHGTVQQVEGDGSNRVLGFRLSKLPGRNIQEFMDLFYIQNQDIRQLLSDMVDRAAETPDVSWRTTVHSPLNELQRHEVATNFAAQSLLLKKTIIAYLQLDTNASAGNDEDSDDDVLKAASKDAKVRCVVWCAEAFTGVLQLSQHGIVTMPSSSVFNQAGVFFGLEESNMVNQCLGLYISYSGQFTASNTFNTAALLASNERKSSLKSTTDDTRIGFIRRVYARHVDGTIFKISVQAASIEEKKGGRKVFIRFIHSRGDEVAIDVSEIQALSRAASMKSTTSGGTSWSRARLPLSSTPSAKIFQVAQQLVNTAHVQGPPGALPQTPTSRRQRRASMAMFRPPPSEFEEVISATKKAGVRFAEATEDDASKQNPTSEPSTLRFMKLAEAAASVSGSMRRNTSMAPRPHAPAPTHPLESQDSQNLAPVVSEPCLPRVEGDSETVSPAAATSAEDRRDDEVLALEPPIEPVYTSNAAMDAPAAVGSGHTPRDNHTNNSTRSPGIHRSPSMNSKLSRRSAKTEASDEETLRIDDEVNLASTQRTKQWIESLESKPETSQMFTNPVADSPDPVTPPPELQVPATEPNFRMAASRAMSLRSVNSQGNAMFENDSKHEFELEDQMENHYMDDMESREMDGGIDAEDEVVGEEMFGSATEETEEESEVMPESIGVGDSNRRKRYKQLMELMQSHAAQKAFLICRHHTHALLGVLLCVHLVSFAMFEHNFIKHMESSGSQLVACQATAAAYKVALDVDVIAVLNSGRSVPGVYNPSQLKELKATLRKDCEDLEKLHIDVFMNEKSIGSTDASLQRLWEVPTISTTVLLDGRPPTFVQMNMSLLDVGNHILESCVSLQTQDNVWIVNNTTNLQDDREFHFIKANAPRGYAQNMNQSMDLIVLHNRHFLKWFADLARTFLGLEGCILYIAAMVYVYILLQGVVEQRNLLFSLFFMVPSGFVRALALQEVVVDSEEEEESGDEGQKESNPHPSQAAGTEGRSFSKSSKPSLEKGNDRAERSGGSKLGGHFEAKKEKMILKQRMEIYRSHSKRWQAKQSSTDWIALMLHTINPKRLIERLGEAIFGQRKRFVGNVASNRQLIRDYQDQYKLNVPFVLWGALVIGIYSFTASHMGHFQTDLMLTNTAYQLVIRAAGVVYHAQALCSATDPGEKAALLDELELRRFYLQNAWSVLVSGGGPDSPGGVLLGSIHHTVDADVFHSNVFAHYFFRNRQACLVGNQSVCHDPSSPYQDLARMGPYAMMSRLLDEVEYLCNEPLIYAQLDNPRLKYIWKVGFYTLLPTLFRSAELYHADLLQGARETELIHMGLFVSSFVAAAVYVSFMFQPIMNRLARETKQVAEFLSQLPAGLDAVSLLANALGKLPEEETSLEREDSQDFEEQDVVGPGEIVVKDLQSPTSVHEDAESAWQIHSREQSTNHAVEMASFSTSRNAK